jgi:hypothetical protein
MKEKKQHSPIEESFDSMMVQEPIASAAAYADTIEDDASLEIPGLPQTWDELMDCIKEGEEEFERGEAIPWDVATSRLKQYIADYVA